MVRHKDFPLLAADRNGRLERVIAKPFNLTSTEFFQIMISYIGLSEILQPFDMIAIYTIPTSIRE